MLSSSLRHLRPRGRRAVAVATVAPLLALGALAAPAAAQTEPAPARAQTAAAPPAPCPAAVPVSQVKAGLTGTGFTVSKGTTPKPFTVQVIGVLKDGIAPGLDLIIVKTDSPAIQAAGGIWAGMSGSPGYTSDGHLLGAVAYGLSGAPSSIGGITPAEEMLKVLHFTSTGTPNMPARVNLSKSLQPRSADTGAASAAQAARGMSQLRVPLAISGLAGAHFNRVAQAITKRQRLTALPFHAGAATSAPASTSKIKPGGNFAAALSYGDVTIAGIGTTTARCHGVALAFGHPLTFGGKVALSIHPANALYVQPDSLFGPFKVANLGGVAGIVDQDRLAAIAGRLGAGPVRIPVTSTISAAGTGLTRTGTTFVNQDADLPFIASVPLLANFDRTFQKIGEGTSLVTSTVTGKTSAGQSFTLTRSNRFASQFDVTFESIFEMLRFLSQIQGQPFVDVHFSKVTIKASADAIFRQYHIDKVFRKTGPNTFVVVNSRHPVRVKAGGSVTLRVRVAPFRDRGPVRNFNFTYRIPKNRAGSSGAFIVRGGGRSGFFGLSCLVGECGGSGGKSFSQILKALGSQPRNDQLIATMFIGPARGTPGSKPAVTKQVRTATQVVTGASFIPVKVTR